MIISLPTRKVKELRELLEEWLTGRSTATVREVVVLAGKHTTWRMCRPGRDFMRRFLQLSKLQLGGGEVRGKGVGRRPEGC